MRLPYFLSNGPKSDRATYITKTDPNSATPGYELAATNGAAFISTGPCILESCYISISSGLAVPMWIGFVDIRPNDLPTPPVNFPIATLTSERLATAGGSFVWQPGPAEEVECHDPVRNIDCGREPVTGFPFDRGLVIVTSSSPNTWTPINGMIRVTARIRVPPDHASPAETSSACNGVDLQGSRRV